MIKFLKKNKNRFEKFEELLKKDNINFSIQESPTCKEYNFSKNYSNTVTFGKVVIFKNNYQNLITICIFRDISKYSKKRFLEIANELNSEFFNVNFFLFENDRKTYDFFLTRFYYSHSMEDFESEDLFNLFQKTDNLLSDIIPQIEKYKEADTIKKLLKK